MKAEKVLGLVLTSMFLAACGQPGDVSLKAPPPPTPQVIRPTPVVPRQTVPAPTPQPPPPPPTPAIPEPPKPVPQPPKPVPQPPKPVPPPPKPVPQPPKPAPPKSVVTKVNRQERISITAKEKVDILFVVDNSVSMKYEQSSMAARFNNFIGSLRGLDWQIAITTTDVSLNAPGKDGRLLMFPNGKYFLRSSDSEKANQERFAHTIQRPLREGNQYEQGIKAAYRAIERGLDDRSAVNAVQAEFFRNDAALAIVFISDADESIPKGKPAEIRNSPEALSQLIEKTWKDKKVIFHSVIVPPGDQKCLKSNNNEAFGLKYAELSNKTGGIIGNVCEKDYGKQLQFMGEKVQQIVHSVELQCDGAEDLDLMDQSLKSVKIGMLVKGRRAHFSQSLPPGEYVLNYTCKVVTHTK